MMKVFRRTLGLAVVTASAVVVPATVAGAASPTTGQPGTSAGFNCGTGNTAPVEPGNAANAPGSAFNETTPGTAGTVYAGNGPGSANSNNPTVAVAQYDTACRVLTFGAAGGLH